MDALALSLNRLVAPQTFIRVNAKSRVDELAKSVGREGLLEPLVVRPSRKELGKYEVVCGLRRYLAAKKAGLETVPCIVKEMDDVEALEAMLIENMERENLSDYELGRWFKLLMERCPDKYPTQQAIAERFNLSRQLVGFLIAHCEVVDQLMLDMPSNIATRVAMLPERVVREVRRANPKHWATLVKAYLRSEDEGKPLGVAGIAALVDSLSRPLPLIIMKKEKKPAPAKPEAEEAKPKAEKSPSELEKPFPERVAVKPAEAVGEAVKLTARAIVEATPQIEAELEKAIEEERKRIINDKIQGKQKRKLDRTSQAYLTLINYYPENFVAFLEKHGDLSHLDESKAIKLAKDILQIIIDEVTEHGKNTKVLEKALQTYRKWL